MKQKTLFEMKGRFDRILTNLLENDMERFEAINSVRDMATQVDGMIGDLGKISSSGIEAAAGARSVLGDGASSAVEQALGEPLSQAAEALAQLKASITQAINQIEGGDGAPSPAMDGDELGSPADAMGEPPVGGDELAGDLADVNLDGAEEERPKKEM